MCWELLCSSCILSCICAGTAGKTAGIEENEANANGSWPELAAEHG